MIQIEQIAQSALEGKSLETRSLTQDYLREHKTLRNLPFPETNDTHVLALSAGLAELFARHSNQPTPAWTAAIGVVNEPVFLVRSALTMRRLRELCETESPLPLRQRKFFAPPNYLEFG